jgi:hypothetical protein
MGSAERKVETHAGKSHYPSLPAHCILLNFFTKITDLAAPAKSLCGSADIGNYSIPGNRKRRSISHKAASGLIAPT